MLIFLHTNLRQNICVTIILSFGFVWLMGCGSSQDNESSESDTKSPPAKHQGPQGNQQENPSPKSGQDVAEKTPETPSPMPLPEQIPSQAPLKPEEERKPTEAELLSNWKGCRSGNTLREYVRDGSVNATTAYLYQLADILSDPYCDDDRVPQFLSYRHFRQLRDRMARMRELKDLYKDLNVDPAVLARTTETISHLQSIQDNFAYFKFSQQMLFWKGFTDYVASEKSVPEILAEGGGKTALNVLKLARALTESSSDLKRKWTTTIAKLENRSIRVPDLRWAPLPPPTGRHGWLPFAPDSSRTFSLGDEAILAKQAEQIEFSNDKAEFRGQLWCNKKQHVYKLTNDDFRMIRLHLEKDLPLLFSLYSVEAFSNFDPDRIYVSAMPDNDGAVAFLLGPGTYYLRLLSWRDVIDADVPLEYSVSLQRGERLRDHLTSGRAFVGYEESQASIKPFRIEFNFAEEDRITGRISWPTLLAETFFEGEYIETVGGTKIRFTETKVAKRSLFRQRVLTGGVYTLEPKVYNGRFVLEGKWQFQNRSGRVRCLAAGLHAISLNDPDRKNVINRLTSDFKHDARIEQDGAFLDAQFTLVYDAARGDTSGYIYWPRHPRKDRIKQYTDGVVIDTPSMLLLRLVDTRFVAKDLRTLPQKTTTFYLSPKSGATGQGFVGRWRQGLRATGVVKIAVE